MTTDALVREARAWIADCIWSDLEAEDVDDLTDARAVGEVHALRPEHTTGNARNAAGPWGGQA